tara:strand:+ start:465 stop:773 length:309 start_codon:yes stop_codon:yes gene_type:complete
MPPRQEPLRDPPYLIWLREQRCILTGQYGHSGESVVPAHIGTAGRGIKTSDDEALPMRSALHNLAHTTGEITMLRREAPDWLIREAFRAYAREMYRKWKDEG